MTTVATNGTSLVKQLGASFATGLATAKAELVTPENLSITHKDETKEIK